MVEKHAKGVSPARSIVTDPALSPATIVNRVVGLHGGDDMKLSKAIEVGGGHVLRMLDPPTAIRGTVGFFDFGVNGHEPSRCLDPVTRYTP